jgi:hypothetical protein
LKLGFPRLVCQFIKPGSELMFGSSNSFTNQDEQIRLGFAESCSMANTLRVEQQPRRRKMGSLLSGLLVLCSTLVTTAQPSFASSSSLQRFVPNVVPVGFVVDRTQFGDDPQLSYPYTMYFSSTTGWFTGTADFSAPRTLIQMYRQNNDDDQRMNAGFSEGRLRIKIKRDIASISIYGTYGSLWWKTPTAFIEIYASSPKMSQAYLLTIAKGIRPNNRADEPKFQMSTPSGTKTKFAGRLNETRKSWWYTLKSPTQEVAIGSEAVSALGFEAEAIFSSPIRQTTVRGRPALRIENQILWMETPDQLVWVALKSPADSSVAAIAETLKPVDETGWQAFQNGPSLSTPTAPPAPTVPPKPNPEPSAPIASGEAGSIWSIARLEYHGKPCYLFTIGISKAILCPQPSELTWTAVPAVSNPGTIFLFGTAPLDNKSIALYDPQGKELGRTATITVSNDPVTFFVTKAKMASQPGTESMIGYNSDGKQVSGPAPFTAPN